VALVDANDRLGGTCLCGMHSNQGAAVYGGALGPVERAERYGIEGVADAKLNWKGVLARKDDVIARHTRASTS